ncbi:MAG: DUF5329 domain-containing protein [Woeseiaceae bacterium]|nr:DUF5329 domain-containing protein [Woeseiaceae bacterium]
MRALAWLPVILAVVLASGPARMARADPASMDAEIDFLLAAVGDSDCVFIRNGREHPAADARDHLEMKRRRGKRYFDTTEEFIERIASRSSLSGREYRIRCPGQPETSAERWFRERLDAFRAGQDQETATRVPLNPDRPQCIPLPCALPARAR